MAFKLNVNQHFTTVDAPPDKPCRVIAQDGEARPLAGNSHVLDASIISGFVRS